MQILKFLILHSLILIGALNFKEGLINKIEFIDKKEFKLNEKNHVYSNFYHEKYYYSEPIKEPIKEETQIKQYKELNEKLYYLERKIENLEIELMRLKKLKNYVNQGYENPSSSIAEDIRNKETYLRNILKSQLEVKEKIRSDINQIKNQSPLSFFKERNSQEKYILHVGAFDNYENASNQKRYMEYFGIPVKIIENYKPNPPMAPTIDDTKKVYFSRQDFRYNPEQGKTEFADFSFFNNWNEEKSMLLNEYKYSKNEREDIKEEYINKDLYLKNKESRNTEKKFKAIYNVVSVDSYQFEEAKRIISKLKEKGVEAYMKRN